MEKAEKLIFVGADHLFRKHRLTLKEHCPPILASHMHLQWSRREKKITMQSI